MPNKGVFCPRYLNDPQTVAGRAALRLALSPGVWMRAGMDGVLVGVNWINARLLAAGVGRGLKWADVSQYLARFETGALVGDARRRKKDKEED